jgi:hypothetical protein
MIARTCQSEQNRTLSKQDRILSLSKDRILSLSKDRILSLSKDRILPFALLRMLRGACRRTRCCGLATRLF